MSLTYAVYLRIVQLCDERELSFNKLCELSGVSQSTISNYASNRSVNISCLPIYKICIYLNITLSDFFNSSLFNKIDINLYK